MTKQFFLCMPEMKENGELVTKKFTDMGGKKKERKKLMNNIK